jgi:hypothetical protein
MLNFLKLLSSAKAYTSLASEFPHIFLFVSQLIFSLQDNIPLPVSIRFYFICSLCEIHLFL